MSLMIAPAASPSMVNAAAGGSDSSDGGSQFAGVLAGQTSAADDARYRVTGAGKRTGQDGADSTSDDADKPAARDAQGAVMLTLAGTIVAPNLTRPAVVTGASGSAGAVPACIAEVSAAASPAGTAGVGAGSVAEVTGLAAGSVASNAASTVSAANSSYLSAKTAMEPASPVAEAPAASAAMATVQATGGAVPSAPAEPGSASAANPAPVGAQVAAAQAAAAQVTQLAKTPTQAAPSKPGPTQGAAGKPGSPEGLGTSTANAAARSTGKADARANSSDGKQEGNRDGRIPSGQVGPTPTAAGQGATQAALVATNLSPGQTVAGLSIANSPAPNPQLAGGQPAATGQGQPATQNYPSVPEPLVRQLAGPVLDVRATGDGSHQLSISLHPAELGPVNLHVRILGDVMTIQLASTSESAHEAIRSALPQLRQELQSAGLAGVDVSLDFNAGSSANSGGTADPRSGSGAEPDPSQLPNVVTARPAIAHRSSGQTHSGLDRWL